MKTILTTLNAKYIHTNLALRFLKAYATPQHLVSIIEFTIKDPIINIVTALMKEKPDLIGFSCYIWNIEETLKITQLLKKINPELLIILGGPEVSYNYHDLFKQTSNVDGVVIGEGEATFKEILDLLTQEQNQTKKKNLLTKVAGLALNQGGKIIVTKPREKLNLQTMPSAYRFPEDVAQLANRITYFETSRGCPFSCQFCLSSIENGVRFFDKEKAKADLLFLIENGAKTIKFMDRTFNTSKSYAMDLFDFLIRHHQSGMSIQFEITADIMSPEIILFLNEHAPEGLFRFEIGVQSTNEYTNSLIHRRQNFDKLKEIVTLIKSGGKITQHLDLIAGLPEENYHSFRQTFNDVFAMRPEELQLGFLKMLHGTGLTHSADRWGYQYMDYPPYEILSNNSMPFADVVLIKQVEDILEKYWNNHRVDTTIEYLVTYVFETAFDFFQQFGSYWEEQGWSRIGHQLDDLYKRIYQFIEESFPEHQAVLLDLLKYDYLINLSYKPRRLWWQDRFPRTELTEIHAQILSHPEKCTTSFVDLQLSEKYLLKHCVIETIQVDPHSVTGKKLIKKQLFFLVYFNPKTRETSYYFFNDY